MGGIYRAERGCYVNIRRRLTGGDHPVVGRRAEAVEVATVSPHFLYIHPAQSAMPIDQIAIPILGAIAGWLSQERRQRLQRWACIFCLIGQPFLFWASWKAEQWGIFAVSVLYGFAWLRGLWVHWITARAKTAPPWAW